MDRKEIESQVRQIVSDILGDAALAGEWDSIQNLNVILAVEQATGLQFSPEEMEKMNGVETIVEIVAAKQGTA